MSKVIENVRRKLRWWDIFRESNRPSLSANGKSSSPYHQVISLGARREGDLSYSKSSVTGSFLSRIKHVGSVTTRGYSRCETNNISSGERRKARSPCISRLSLLGIIRDLTVHRSDILELTGSWLKMNGGSRSKIGDGIPYASLVYRTLPPYCPHW